MAENKNENVVVAIFPNQYAADQAIDGLKSWDMANEDIKLGAIGTLVKEGDKVKTHVGHKAGRGAGVGAVVGLIAGVLSGGLTMLGGLIAGTVLGGGAGALMKQSLHLTKEEIESLGNELDAGKVAVVVTCDEHEIEPTKQQLETFGGTTRTYGVPQSTLAEVTQTLAVAEGAALPTASKADTVVSAEEDVPFPTPEAGATSETVTSAKSVVSEAIASGETMASDAMRTGESAASDTMRAGESAASDTMRAGETMASDAMRTGETGVSDAMKAGESAASEAAEAGDSTTPERPPQ